ncbi:MAG: Gfo/Idh/MocA family oxidoreductase [Anaerolineae bacterium]
MSQRLRVGVIGCGGVAQMMHLPYLTSLGDKFEVAAIADLSAGVLRTLGERYNVPENHRFTRFQDLVALDLDAVLVTTSGNHYAQVRAALDAGKHVLSEKPVCYSAHEAEELIEAARRADRKLMVAYMKRYDPGYLWAQAQLRQMSDLRYIQINTLHPAEDDYLRIHNIVRYNDIPAETLKALQAQDNTDIIAAVGEIAPALRSTYANVLLGSMVHDVNALRGLVGDPEGVPFTEIWFDGHGDPTITTVFQYPERLRAIFTWTYLPDLRNYFEEIALMSPANRLRIQFPSPYLKHFPSPVVFEGMAEGVAFEKRVIASYDEAFRRELVAFYDCIANNTPPLTDAADARADIRLLQQVLAAFKPEGLGGEAAAGRSR